MAETWHLRLCVAGMTHKCSSAIQNLNRICRERLHEQYAIEIVDLLENPSLARGDQILAIPAAVRHLIVTARRRHLLKEEFSLESVKRVYKSEQQDLDKMPHRHSGPG
jgi:hypothetical protein